MNEINNNLQRVRELTVQAQNSTNTASDIDSIQQEVNQRLQEIERVASQTDFNGIKVFDKNADKTFKIQVGANDNQTIDIEIKAGDKWNLWQGGVGVDGNTVTNGTRTEKVYGFDVLASAGSSPNAEASTLAVAIASAAATENATYDPADSRVVSYGGTDKQYAVIVNDGADDVAAYAVTFDAEGHALLGGKLDGVAEQAALAAPAGDNVY